jgi:hypothetical protein
MRSITNSGMTNTTCDQYHGTSRLTLSPSQDVSSTAVTYFLNAFSGDSPFDYLASVYVQSAPSSTIAVATQCAAIASLASAWKDSRMMDGARIQYSLALTLTSAVLRSPVDALSDSSLISVILLSIFEAITCQGRHFSDAWLAHIDGAATMVRLRGQQQFNTPLGRRLFVYIANNVRISNMHRNMRRFDDFKALLRHAWSVGGPNESATGMAALMDAVVDLRTELKQSKNEKGYAQLLKSGVQTNAKHLNFMKPSHRDTVSKD